MATASAVAYPVVVAKCADSLPLYRQAKQLARLGIPIARSTLTDLFHQVAVALKPLSDRLVELVGRRRDRPGRRDLAQDAEAPTSAVSSGPSLANNLIAYCFSADRSGETPAQVLGASTGTLVVDMYTGYNAVTGTGKRERAACLAHARRRTVRGAGSYAPEARVGLELIRDVYVVEHDAKAEGIAGTEAHTRMRQARSAPIMTRPSRRSSKSSGLCTSPKGPMGSAISYALNNWEELTRFLKDARIPPDNNRSESALRVVAIGRRNFLFVGHEDRRRQHRRGSTRWSRPAKPTA